LGKLARLSPLAYVAPILDNQSLDRVARIHRFHGIGNMGGVQPMKYYVEIEAGPISNDCNSYADALRNLDSQINSEFDSLIEQSEDSIEANSYTDEFYSVMGEIERELASGPDTPTNNKFTVYFAGRNYNIFPI
jgi:hypothetical protein